MAVQSNMDLEYEILYRKFQYLQQQTVRLGAAYTLARQEFEGLDEDNKILAEKLLKIRLRRRCLGVQAETNMNSTMNAKTLFCRRNRKILRKEFPLISRDQLTLFLDEEWQSLPKESMEKWQREFKTFIPKQKTKSRDEKSHLSSDLTPMKKGPTRSRKKQSNGTPSDETKRKPKRATPRKKTDSIQKKPKRSPAKKKNKKNEEIQSKSIDDDEENGIDENSSGNSSIAPSDEDDSDDNLMHLPTGAFG